MLRGAKPEDILGALTGVALGPADLQAILTGCVVPEPQADRRAPTCQRMGVDRSGRRRHALSRSPFADVADGRQVRQIGSFARRAAQAGRSSIQRGAAAFRNRSVCSPIKPAPMVDLTATLSQIETNKDLEGAAFTVNVPPGAEPITLDELRDTRTAWT